MTASQCKLFLSAGCNRKGQKSTTLRDHILNLQSPPCFISLPITLSPKINHCPLLSCQTPPISFPRAPEKPSDLNLIVCPWGACGAQLQKNSATLWVNDYSQATVFAPFPCACPTAPFPPAEVVNMWSRQHPRVTYYNGKFLSPNQTYWKC